ncbi:3641_t:CDS:2 [Gigaspora margarita]|uniref:3641_t:CDS:1 n=1 Tax=Gigaspora margarita TaxID=4874 RepID=A0ABN7URX2_GIGMA|nr:3641_t:CDS:2 [Gigaspora margarita]
MSDKWKEIYKLQEWINEYIYEELNETVANITKELNASGYEKEVLELRLRQGLLQVGCIEKKISIT